MKHRIIILFSVFFLLFCTACTPKDDYQWEGHSKEEILTLFQSNPDMFQQIADIFINNETFWEKARRDEEAAHATLDSPNDTEKMSYFSEEEQNVIRDFFEQTTPYLLSLNPSTFTFDYINEDHTSSFTFAYYFGDKTEKSSKTETMYELWIKGQKGFYSDFQDLGNYWFFYA